MKRFLKAHNLLHAFVATVFGLGLLACGPQQELASTDVRDAPDAPGPATINYTFGTPNGFAVTTMDQGVHVYYNPNPEVDHYILYIGSDEELTEIDGVESPVDVGEANSIQISVGSSLAGQTLYFAVKAVSPDGEEAPLTTAKSVTIQDLLGEQVAFAAVLETCVQERTKFQFIDGQLKIYFNEDGSDMPGSDTDRCGIHGTRLKLRRLNGSSATGPTYTFPAGGGAWSALNVGSTLDIKLDEGAPVFVNMVETEAMVVSKDGEFKKSCEGVSLSRVYGRVESDDDDVTNIIDLDARNCAQNNWFTFIDDERNTEIEFTLYFQTLSP
jgi:hypothetical protein